MDNSTRNLDLRCRECRCARREHAGKGGLCYGVRPENLGRTFADCPCRRFVEPDDPQGPKIAQDPA